MNGLECNNRYFAFTGLGCDSLGLNIVLKDRLGNTTTISQSVLKIDNTKPHISSLTSTNSNVRFKVHSSNPNIYYVYTGSTSVTSVPVEFTWVDNAGGIGLYDSGFWYTIRNLNPINDLNKFFTYSYSYTNGQTHTLSRSSYYGDNSFFLAEDQMGNYNYLCLCIKSEVAPEGAVSSVSISE